MPISRYEGRTKAANTNEMYKDYFDRKGQKFFKQYVTGMLSYPSEQQIERLDLIYHTWGMGDRYDKLASVHYGDPRLWFIIAWFNNLYSQANGKSDGLHGRLVEFFYGLVIWRR